MDLQMPTLSNSESSKTSGSSLLSCPIESKPCNVSIAKDGKKSEQICVQYDELCPITDISLVKPAKDLLLNYELIQSED